MSRLWRISLGARYVLQVDTLRLTRSPPVRACRARNAQRGGGVLLLGCRKAWAARIAVPVGITLRPLRQATKHAFRAALGGTLRRSAYPIRLGATHARAGIHSVKKGKRFVFRASLVGTKIKWRRHLASSAPSTVMPTRPRRSSVIFVRLAPSQRAKD